MRMKPNSTDLGPWPQALNAGRVVSTLRGLHETIDAPTPAITLVERLPGAEDLLGGLEVSPGVFVPTRVSQWFALTLAGELGNRRVLEIGVGCGIVGKAVAPLTSIYVGTDISISAVVCAAANLSHIPTAHVLAANLSTACRMDFTDVIFNPPFFCGVCADLLDSAWYYGETPEIFEELGLLLRESPASLHILFSSHDHAPFETLTSTIGREGVPVATLTIGCETVTYYRYDWRT